MGYKCMKVHRPSAYPYKCTVSRRPRLAYTLKSPPFRFLEVLRRFYIREDIRELCAYAWNPVSVEIRLWDFVSTYHGLNVGVGHGIELLEIELVVRADVDVGTPVLCRVAVSRSRED